MKRPGSKQRAFTLIEMLVVITIIGIIASMVLGLAGLAAQKKKEVVAKAAVQRLELMIDNYHSKLGFYPPDNVFNTNTANYEQTTAVNQLLYELAGSTLLPITPSTYLAYDGSNILASSILTQFGRGGIANSNPDEPHIFYYPLPKPGDYAFYPNTTLKGLTVPIPGVPNSTGPNFIHYDSSSTNRHNIGTFDVWVEYAAGLDKSTGLPLIITNGNWNP